MKTLSVIFDFEIGEMVYFKAARHTMEGFPRRYMIVERIAQQCPGGVQLQYRLGDWDGRHLTNEIELSRDMPPYERSLPERRQEARDLRAAEQEESSKHWKMAVKAEAAKSE